MAVPWTTWDYLDFLIGQKKSEPYLVRLLLTEERLAQRFKGCPGHVEDDLTVILLRRVGQNSRKVRQAAIFQQLRLL